MTAFVDRILQEFHPDLGRFWIVADPDDVLLDEQVLAGLRERGFDVIPFEDSVAFRLEYEERYRSAWDSGSVAPAAALILHLPRADEGDLPWDYERQARKVSLSLAELFPKLSYAVVRGLGHEILPTLFDAQQRHAPQTLGETATKEFVLLHVYRISPHLISTLEDFWRELLRLHYRDASFAGDSCRPRWSGSGTILERLRACRLRSCGRTRAWRCGWCRMPGTSYLADMGISGVRAHESRRHRNTSRERRAVPAPRHTHDRRLDVPGWHIASVARPNTVPGNRSHMDSRRNPARSRGSA
jgi:hypothetical protein